jgi:hypothetical protein
VARLEQSREADRVEFVGKLDDVEGRVKALDQKITPMEFNVANVAGYSGDLQTLRRLIVVLKIFGVFIVTSLLGAIWWAAVLMSQSDSASEDVIELKGRHEHTERVVQSIDTSVQRMSSSLDEWKKAEERRLDEAEKRMERIESKRHR